MIFDDIRARYPNLGFSLFAMEPGEVVTLETYAPDGTVFPFVGDTVEAVLAKAFPEMIDVGVPIAEPEPAEPTEPVASVFD